MKKFNHVKARKAISLLIEAMGEDPKREGLLDTPKRVAKAYEFWTQGLRQDPSSHLKVTFTQKTYDQMVSMLHIEFYSLCEHHFASFGGEVHIGYIPNGRVVGLSKLARTVEVFARRPQIQEQMTDQIADAIDRYLKPLGCIVVVEAKHMCVCSRGVGKQKSTMRTSALRGIFRTEPHATNEFFQSIARSQS